MSCPKITKIYLFFDKNIKMAGYSINYQHYLQKGCKVSQ